MFCDSDLALWNGEYRLFYFFLAQNVKWKIEIILQEPKDVSPTTAKVRANIISQLPAKSFVLHSYLEI